MTTIPSPIGADALSQFTQLQDILRCFICFGRVHEARMCPLCSKMCCRACITKWLTERKTQCPYCRAHLEVSSLVNCRWMEDLYAELERLEQKKRQESAEICKEHQAPLHYFCSTCNDSICADCAMFGTGHTSHAFERLSDVYERHTKQLMAEVKLMQARLQQLQALEANAETNIRRVRAAKEERIVELQTAFAEIDARLTAQLKTKLLTLQSHKNEILKESNLLECLLHELSSQLDATVCPRTVLIKKTPELKQMLQEIQSKPFAHFLKEPVSSDFLSEIVPNYESASFEVKNFREIRRQEEVVYSEPLVTNGLTWRLKVYPNGNGIARDMFISVFLELSAGFSGSSKYEYRVEMLNYADPRKMVSRVFASHFEIGECWGYNRFFRIDMLEEDGYLSPDGTLKLNFYVRSPNFYYLCRDQARYIEFLERGQTDIQRKSDENKSASTDGVTKENIHSSAASPVAPVDVAMHGDPPLASLPGPSSVESQDSTENASGFAQRLRSAMVSKSRILDPSFTVAEGVRPSFLGSGTIPAVSVTPPNSAPQSQSPSPLPMPNRTFLHKSESGQSNRPEAVIQSMSTGRPSVISSSEGSGPALPASRAVAVPSPPLSHEAKTVTLAENNSRHSQRAGLHENPQAERRATAAEFLPNQRFGRSERDLPSADMPENKLTIVASESSALAASYENRLQMERSSTRRPFAESPPTPEVAHPERPDDGTGLADRTRRNPVPNWYQPRFSPKIAQAVANRAELMRRGGRLTAYRQHMVSSFPSPSLLDADGSLISSLRRQDRSRDTVPFEAVLSEHQAADPRYDDGTRSARISTGVSARNNDPDEDMRPEPHNEPEREFRGRNQNIPGHQAIFPSRASEFVTSSAPLRTVRSVLVSPTSSTQRISSALDRNGQRSAVGPRRPRRQHHFENWEESTVQQYQQASDAASSLPLEQPPWTAEEDPSDVDLAQAAGDTSLTGDDATDPDADTQEQDAAGPMAAEVDGLNESISERSLRRSQSGSHSGSDSDAGTQDVDFDSVMLSVSSSPHGSSFRAQDGVPELDVDTDAVEPSQSRPSVLSPSRPSRKQPQHEQDSIWESQRQRSAATFTHHHVGVTSNMWSGSTRSNVESKTNSPLRLQIEAWSDPSMPNPASRILTDDSGSLIHAAHGLEDPRPLGRSVSSPGNSGSHAVTVEEFLDFSAPVGDVDDDLLVNDEPRFEEVKEIIVPDDSADKGTAERHSYADRPRKIVSDDAFRSNGHQAPSPPLRQPSFDSGPPSALRSQFAVLFNETDCDDSSAIEAKASFISPSHEPQVSVGPDSLLADQSNESPTASNQAADASAGGGGSSN